MIEQTFKLIPFPAPHIPAVSLTGRLSLENQVLRLHYLLVGNTGDLLLPPASPDPGRKHELWKATCFEFFLAIKDQPGYWEFNISPSGDWNAYRMDSYRRIGFREENTISQLLSVFTRRSEGCSLDVSVDLVPLIEPADELQAAVTAILQTRDGSETYWALTHAGPQADFHLRDSFILPLGGRTPPSVGSARDG